MNQHRKSSKVLGDDLIRILEDVTQGYAPSPAWPGLSRRWATFNYEIFKVASW